MMVVWRTHYFAMILFVVLGFILVTCGVESSTVGVCKKTETYKHTWTRMEMQTYQTYCARCPNKTKQVRIMWPKALWEIRNKSEDICCNGYKGDPANGRPCKPECDSPCKNGFCSAPNSCSCNVGYKMSPEQTCKPYCSMGCSHGKCLGPDICLCDKGYKISKSFICEPQCFNGCPSNERCVRPNECQCNEGYGMSKNNICEPRCPQGCPNGKCIRPGVCDCNVGYQMSENKTCDPQCSEGCANGKCYSPNVCQCNNGYKMSKNNICEPHCSTECIHGICVAPNKCSCDTGYLSSNGTCIPSCVYECGNGKCTKPNVCTCAPGYINRLYNNIVDEGRIEGPLCIPKCTNCDGLCIAPQQCICQSPYIAKNVTIAGGLCDSFDAVDGMVMCYKTICVLKKSTVDLNTKNYGLEIDSSTTTLVEMTDNTEKTYNENVKHSSTFGNHFGNVELTEKDANKDLALGTTDLYTFGKHIQESSTIKEDELMWDDKNMNITDHDTSDEDIGISSTSIINDKFTQEDIINMTTYEPADERDVVKFKHDSGNKSIPLWAHIVIMLMVFLIVVGGFSVYYRSYCMMTRLKRGSYKVEDQNEDYNFPSIQFTGVMSMEVDSSLIDDTMECVH